MDTPVLVAEVPAQIAPGAAAVEIAQINADRDVAIATEETTRQAAQTEAMVTVAEVEAETDDEDVQWLKAELASLRAQCETHAGSLSAQAEVIQAQGAQIAELTGLVAALTSQLNPPPLSPAEPETPAVVDPESAVADGPRAENGEVNPPAKPLRKVVPL